VPGRRGPQEGVTSNSWSVTGTSGVFTTRGIKNKARYLSAAVIVKKTFGSRRAYKSARIKTSVREVGRLRLQAKVKLQEVGHVV